MRANLLGGVALALLVSATAHAQSKVLLFDMAHGQTEPPGLNLLERYTALVAEVPGGTFRVNRQEITPAALKGVAALIVMTPFSPPKEPVSFSPTERKAIVDFVRAGGRALVIAEEERRMDLEVYGINDITRPFGMEFGPDTPVRNNVGAIALQGEISPGRRELPYSGGRILTGGTALTIVNDEGGYQHMAYVKLPNGGRIIASGDAMAQFFLGSAEGQRLSGAGGARGDAIATGQPAGARGRANEGVQSPTAPPPAVAQAGAVPPAAAPPTAPGQPAGGRGFALATRFWGKDSELFMREVITWLLQ